MSRTHRPLTGKFYSKNRILFNLFPPTVCNMLLISMCIQNRDGRKLLSFALTAVNLFNILTDVDMGKT